MRREGQKNYCAAIASAAVSTRAEAVRDRDKEAQEEQVLKYLTLGTKIPNLARGLTANMEEQEADKEKEAEAGTEAACDVSASRQEHVPARAQAKASRPYRNGARTRAAARAHYSPYPLPLTRSLLFSLFLFFQHAFASLLFLVPRVSGPLCRHS
jgi:hypothetical protein